MTFDTTGRSLEEIQSDVDQIGRDCDDALKKSDSAKVFDNTLLRDTYGAGFINGWFAARKQYVTGGE